MKKAGAAVIAIALLSGCSTRGNLTPQELTSLREQSRVLNVQESRCSNFDQYAAGELLKALDEDHSACKAKCATLDEANPGAEARVFDLMALHRAQFELSARSKLVTHEATTDRIMGKRSTRDMLKSMVEAHQNGWQLSSSAAAARQMNFINDREYLAYIKATMTTADHNEAHAEACQQTFAECVRSIADPAIAKVCEQKYRPDDGIAWLGHHECDAAQLEGPIEAQVRKRLEGEDPRWKAAQDSVLNDSIDKVEPEPPETRCKYLSDQIRELDSRIYYGDPANCAGPCWMTD